jgi:hypothetical protein
MKGKNTPVITVLIVYLPSLAICGNRLLKEERVSFARILQHQ